MISSKEENIILAAEKLFAEKGFDATSTREISAAAKVNISMISYYFGSKEQLLEKIFEYRMKESTNFSREVMEKELTEWEKLLAIIYLYVGRVENLRDFYRVLQREQITNKNVHILEFMHKSKMAFLQVYSKLLQDGHAKGLFRKTPRAEFLHATIIGTVFYAMNNIPVYSEYSGTAEDAYKKTFFEDLKIHLKTLLKNLLGYEEK